MQGHQIKKNICQQFSHTETIHIPTHFTEHFSSVIDIILTNNETRMVFSGVGDPLLNQDIRYHYLVFDILYFRKPEVRSYLRRT